MAISYNTDQIPISLGNDRMVIGSIAADSSYPTGGYAFLLSQIGFTTLDNIYFQPTSGYSPQYDYTNNKVLFYSGASGTTGSTSGGTPSEQTFTGTASALNLASPAFSGTGLTAAGQVITTTSTHTMTLNQCAGMWLISATGSTPPNLILSNTAVTGAAAVLTVQGAASTDAGAYKIVATLPVGTNSASAALAGHTHSVGAAAGAEIANATNLSTLTTIRFVAIGN